MNEEILDIVNQEDLVIGSMPRDQIYQQKKLFRAINGFIINSDNKLWIPRRHHTKKLFPSHLDASVGGHVASGESYDEAFRRETQEELRIDVSQIPYRIVGKLTPGEHKTSAFMIVYAFYQDEVPDYNQNDFTEYYWLSIPEFFSQLKAGDKAKSDLPIILKELNHLL